MPAETWNSLASEYSTNTFIRCIFQHIFQKYPLEEEAKVSLEKLSNYFGFLTSCKFFSRWWALTRCFKLYFLINILDDTSQVIAIFLVDVNQGSTNCAQQCCWFFLFLFGLRQNHFHAPKRCTLNLHGFWNIQRWVGFELWNPCMGTSGGDGVGGLFWNTKLCNPESFVPVFMYIIFWGFWRILLFLVWWNLFIVISVFLSV